jgi:RNA polymerase sigma factor (sigma-70 family)
MSDLSATKKSLNGVTAAPLVAVSIRGERSPRVVMRHAALSSFMQMVRRVAARHARDEQAGGDAELLARFVRQGDEAAFEVLVHRHGPMVWSVCRRLLTRTEDAEDAFQAAFVVLLRRAGSIRDGSLLGNWLYGVAYRVAVRARARAARRAAREKQGMRTEPAAMATETATDWQPLLHEEVFRLPEKYRRPIVMCYLNGQTNEEAAAALGWPVGTVKGRLSRARELLRVRLGRRGVCLAGAALTGTLSAARLDAAVPPTLMQATLTGAVTGTTAGISPHVLTLSKGVMQSMFWNKCATFGTALAMLALLAGGTMLSYHGLSALAQDRAAGGAAPIVPTPPPQAQLAPQADAQGKRNAGGNDAMKIQGIWKLESWEFDGQLKPAEAIKDMTLEVNAKGEWRLSFGPGKQPNQALVFIDPAQEAAVMEVRGPNGRVFRSGLHKVEGDTLTICSTAWPGASPPKDLKSSAEHDLWVWKRTGK